MKSMYKAGAAAVVAIGLGSAALAGGTVWDNGDWDETIAEANGYSHITTGGLDRRVLSDISFGDEVNLFGFTMDGVWTTGNTGLGTGIRLWIRSDVGGTPGDVITELTTGNYNEVTTGGTAFSRPIVNTSVDITGNGNLAAGNYWIEMQIQGPENFFHLTSFGADSLIGEETWANYPDFGGLQPASAIFGVQAEVNFKLFGEIVPAPGAMALLGLAGLAARRRRRA